MRGWWPPLKRTWAFYQELSWGYMTNENQYISTSSRSLANKRWKLMLKIDKNWCSKFIKQNDIWNSQEIIFWKNFDLKTNLRGLNNFQCHDFSILFYHMVYQSSFESTVSNTRYWYDFPLLGNSSNSRHIFIFLFNALKFFPGTWTSLFQNYFILNDIIFTKSCWMWLVHPFKVVKKVIDTKPQRQNLSCTLKTYINCYIANV